MKSFLKNILYQPLFKNVLASRAISQWLLHDATIILLYHEVSDNPSRFHQRYQLNVTPTIFEEQIKIFKKQFNIISPAEFLKGNYKKPAILLTFDDGTAGYFENAVPILKKHTCPSLIFLNMEPIIEGKVFWSGLVTYLCDHDPLFVSTMKNLYPRMIKEPSYLYIRPSWVEKYLLSHNQEEVLKLAKDFYGYFATSDHLAACKNNSLVVFGNHLYNHYNCHICSNDEIKESFLRNQRCIEAYPNASRFFSYPFGREASCYDNRTTQQIQSLNAQRIFSSYPKDFTGKGDVVSRLPMDERVQSEEDFRRYLLIKKARQFLGF